MINLKKILRRNKSDPLIFENMWEINFGYGFYVYHNNFKYDTILEKNRPLHNSKI